MRMCRISRPLVRASMQAWPHSSPVLRRARSRTVPRMRPWHSTNCISCNRTSPSTTGNTVCQPFPRPQTMPPIPCPAMAPGRCRYRPLPQHRLCVRTTIVHDSSIRRTRTKPPSCRRSRQIRRQPPAWLWKRTTSPPTTFQLPPRTVRSVVDSRNAVASVHLSSSPS